MTNCIHSCIAPNMNRCTKCGKVWTEAGWIVPEPIVRNVNLFIIRGLPGSGKSTLARTLQASIPGLMHIEADHFFESPQGYTFDPGKLSQAHEWCKCRVRGLLQAGRSVAVANTFSRRWEYAPYIELGEVYRAQTHLITVHGTYQNVHNVPDHVIERMRECWET